MPAIAPPQFPTLLPLLIHLLLGLVTPVCRCPGFEALVRSPHDALQQRQGEDGIHEQASSLSSLHLSQRCHREYPHPTQ
ncbi:hypothetical protein BDY17DRAFT_290486 [Neohortaea acidophila]|uniref:Secreted protein n=1 Tax=Neohortaea acidophila TaxID=245834 RepID=A0A6A6Q0V6_9PEZI|nr:uncharacterized protein BDY17DRAFT_290486 [Neohortaea acidophila]KAF2485895.1 hypothetical protein BDY17DRAFT_290486 [Neohortaea acidophila]